MNSPKEQAIHFIQEVMHELMPYNSSFSLTSNRSLLYPLVPQSLHGCCWKFILAMLPEGQACCLQPPESHSWGSALCLSCTLWNY